VNKQIRKATYYIEKNLDDELDIDKLALVAGYSPYHFCRIFKIHVGESAISYATRLKLERAAGEMILKNKSMIDVALDAGFKTPTGFLKAFKSRFGTTPTNYRKGTKVQLNKHIGVDMNIPEIVFREEVKAVFTRELGAYEKSSNIAWNRLSSQMNGLKDKFKQRKPQTPMKLGLGNAEAIGICLDNPNVTDESNIRYEAALVWDKEDVVELTRHYGFESKIISGGKYAKVDYIGEDSEDAWHGLYKWVESKGYEFRDEPAFEKYLNATSEEDKSKHHKEVYIPII